MEPIATVDAVDLRDAKAQVLRACRPWNDDPVGAGRQPATPAVRSTGRDVPDYTAEPGVDPARNTETLAELIVEIDNWRWSGVPFRLRSGKALRERRKEVLVTFKPLPHLPTGFAAKPIPDQLRLTMGPDRMALEMNVNGPDDPFDWIASPWITDLNPGRLPAYGEVLAGVLDGDPLLSVRGDTAEECWRIVDPVLQAWREKGAHGRVRRWIGRTCKLGVTARPTQRHPAGASCSAVQEIGARSIVSTPFSMRADRLGAGATRCWCSKVLVAVGSSSASVLDSLSRTRPSEPTSM